jgi:hypothetical protein
LGTEVSSSALAPVQTFGSARMDYLPLQSHSWTSFANIPLPYRISFNITMLIIAVFALAAAGSPNWHALVSFAALWSVGVGGNLPVDSAIFLGKFLNSLIPRSVLSSKRRSHADRKWRRSRIHPGVTPILAHHPLNLVGFWSAHWKLSGCYSRCRCRWQPNA